MPDNSDQRNEEGLLVRSYRSGDYDAVIGLWQAVGFGPDERDSPQALEYKLHRDEGPFLVAESDGRVVGTVMASWDGRRAWVYRLTVEPTRQARGIGTRLMAEVESKLRDLGARTAALLVLASNEPVVRLYRRLGYEIEEGVAFMKKLLEPGEERDDGL